MDYYSILLNEEATDPLVEGINELAAAVLVTMGPGGSTVIIKDPNTGDYKVTKDGVSVAKSVWFKDPVKTIGAELIKEVANNTVREAGDGTTTSICLANALINKGVKLDLPNKRIIEELENLEHYTLKYLDKLAKPIEPHQINQVATIAANGDSGIGDIIAEAYKFSEVIKVDYGNGKEDNVELVDGFTVGGGIVSNAFINNGANQTIDYKNGMIIIVEGHLTDLQPISSTLKGMPPTTPIIIMADEFSPRVMGILRDNYNKGAMTVGLIKTPGYAEHRENLRTDLVVITNGSQRKGFTVGHFKSIKAGIDFTTLSCDTNERKDSLKKDLKNVIKNIKEDHSKDLMQQRINNLEGTLATILVGGKSELEMKERYDRVEDAVLATQCAIDEGIIEGAGKALAVIGHSINNSHAFCDCLKEPMVQIVKNGSTHYPVGSDLLKEGIIDPVKVTKVALINAISVAKTILGTRAIVI
tara:strand:- start:6900 stop:8315 length:1416 start_codon:yes stop_codon:yes gene_type:complete